uniref:Neprilysin n=3 Tax=Culex pipiens TaxID=7175 RepID=A0A8D8A0M2_CULPI
MMSETTEDRFIALSVEAAANTKSSTPKHLTVIIRKEDSGCHVFCRRFFMCILLLAVVFLTSIIYGIYYFANTLPDVCHSKECLRSAATLKQNMNLQVDPCEDFYGYVCGNWADDHPRPENRIANSWYQERQLKIFRNIRSQLERNASRTDPKPVAQARTMYQACLNYDAREKEGAKVIAKYLQEFGLPTLPTLLNHTRFGPRRYKFDWIATVARIQRKLGLNVLIGFDIVMDQEDRNRNRLTLEYHYSPDLLNFPAYEWSKLHSKGYRSSVEPVEEEEEPEDEDDNDADDGPDAAELADGFLKIAEAINPGFNGSKYEASFMTLGETYMDFFNQLPGRKADNADDSDDQEEEQLSYYTVQELQNITDAYIAPDKPYPIWQHYLDELFAPFPGAKPTAQDKLQMSDENIDFLKKLVRVVSRQPIQVVELYIWGLVTTYIVSHEYNELETEEDCAKNVQTLMGLAVSYAIADKNFLEGTKPRVEAMLNDIRDEFNQMVLETNWMDAYTKYATLEKSKSMESLIGFPEWILDVRKLEEHYQGLQIKKNRHLENWVSAIEFLMKDRLQTWRVKNEKYWDMDPTEVNAFNVQNRNAINIPVAIIQYPFYFLGLEALNYGALGEILGHELTHGFDDSGRNYDKYGYEKRWWSNHTLQEYDKRADCLVKQYSKYYLAEAKGFINGTRTLGENIADNGGVREALRAYQAFVKRHGPEPTLPGFDDFSHEQLFFISFANLWCSTLTPGRAKALLSGDAHSPGMFRVRGTVSNMPEFSEAFRCAPGTAMNPARKCRVW